MTERDFYDVLGVAKSASGHDIKEAYRKLAFLHHPDRDRSPEAEQRFKEVSQAYSVLSDPEKRALYDALGPEKYDDPWEVLLYRLERETERREVTREYEASRSAQQYEAAGSTAILIFFLLLLDLEVPPWVLGPWYYIINGFLILCILIGIYESLDAR
jgi:curved DNA-binding protein CbpA